MTNEYQAALDALNTTCYEIILDKDREKDEINTILRALQAGAKAEELGCSLEDLVSAKREGRIVEWQPIETAPRDGTEILILTKRGVQQGYWHQPANPKFDGTWVVLKGTNKHATHWAHLPPAPKKESE